MRQVNRMSKLKIGQVYYCAHLNLVYEVTYVGEDYFLFRSTVGSVREGILKGPDDTHGDWFMGSDWEEVLEAADSWELLSQVLYLIDTESVDL